MTENSENNEENQIPGLAGSSEQRTSQDSTTAGRGRTPKRTTNPPDLSNG